MDGQRFDLLARAFAKGATRRALLRGLLGLGGAAAVGGTLLRESDARTVGTRPGISSPPSPTPNPTPSPTPTPVPCPSGEVTCAMDGCCAGVCTAEGRCCGTGTVICGEDCCTEPLQCCDGECCPGDAVCLARVYGETAAVDEEVCCPKFLTCDGQCCSGGCFTPLGTALAGFDRECCPAGQTVCAATDDLAGQALCCGGDTPECCVRDGAPHCIDPETQCCLDPDCPDETITCRDGVCDGETLTCGLSGPCEFSETGSRCCEGNCRECCDDEDCDADVPCITNTCNSETGICEQSEKENGSSCGQGALTCLNGECCACRDANGKCYESGALNPSDLCESCDPVLGWITARICFSLNKCETQRCDPGSGVCVSEPANENEECSVFIPGPCSTSTGTCKSGVCVPDPDRTKDGTACFGCEANESCATCRCASGACVAVEKPDSDGKSCEIIDTNFCDERVCRSGQCVVEPANEGLECGTQPLDTCQQAVCRSGACTAGYAGPDNAGCWVSDPCIQGHCSSSSGGCIQLGTVSCPAVAGCTAVACNSTTGACDIYTAPASGTRICAAVGIEPRPCCPTQVCAAETCSQFETTFRCFDPEALDDRPGCTGI